MIHYIIMIMTTEKIITLKIMIRSTYMRKLHSLHKNGCVQNSAIYTLRENGLAIYFGESQFKLNRIFIFISKIVVDKHLRVRGQ